MCNLRDVVIFLAGAAFFHTLSHIVLPYVLPLPINMGFMVLTNQFNCWVIGVSALVTIALLWWACKLSKK